MGIDIIQFEPYYGGKIKFYLFTFFYFPQKKMELLNVLLNFMFFYILCLSLFSL
jgi:hypothetical protein